MAVKLTVSKGPNKGKSFCVSVPQFVIGRAKGCQLRPQSDAISRQHCVICVTEQSVTVRDLGSRNGTIVNGEPTEGTHTLADGDELRIGPLYLTVSLKAEQTTRAEPKETSPSDSETVVAATDETQNVKPETKPKQPATDPTATRILPAVGGQSGKKISDSDDIGDWLTDEFTSEATTSKDETRRFRLDETERIEIAKAASEVVEDKKAPDKKSKKKKEPGKLPKLAEETTADSREAAEATLRKMLQRGL